MKIALSELRSQFCSAFIVSYCGCGLNKNNRKVQTCYIDIMSTGVKWEIHCIFLRFVGFKDPTHLQYNMTKKHCKIEISFPIRQLLCICFIFCTVCSAWRWPTLRSKHVALLKYICASCIDCHCVISSWNTQWRSWLRHCASNWIVAGSFPDGAIRVFHIP